MSPPRKLTKRKSLNKEQPEITVLDPEDNDYNLRLNLPELPRGAEYDEEYLHKQIEKGDRLQKLMSLSKYKEIDEYPRRIQKVIIDTLHKAHLAKKALDELNRQHGGRTRRRRRRTRKV